MIEKKLKSLANVQVNEQRKEESWQEIQQQLSKKAPFQWQVPSVILASVALLFILIMMPLNTSVPSPTTAAGDRPVANVTTVYASKYYLPKTEPKSNFYPAVVKLDEAEFLQKLNTMLNATEWTEFRGYLPTDGYQYRLIYADGTSKYFSYYQNGKAEFLIDRSSRYAYVYQNENQYGVALEMLLREGMQGLSWISYTAFMLILFLRAWHDSSYKRKNRLDRQPKMHTSHWQSVSTIAIAATLILTTFLTEQVHFAWWIIGIGLNIFLCLKINKVEEHHAWRIRSILIMNFTFIVYAVGLLYTLF